MYSSQLSKYFVFIKFVQILKLMILNIEKFTGYFLGQFYPDMWFFWIRLQAEGGTKKFGTTDLKSWFFYAHLIINNRHFRSEQFMKVILI